MQVRPGGSEGEPLTAGEHGCCLSRRSWSVPGTSLTKWAFLSGFGILSAIITKTGVLHMAGKPRLVQFSSTSVQFPFPNPSLLRKSTKNHIIWPRDVLGSALCLRKDKTKKKSNPKQHCFLMSRKALCVATWFLPGSTLFKTTGAS